MENYEINNTEELQAQDVETPETEEESKLDVSGMAQLALMIVGGVFVVKKTVKGALKLANWVGGKIKAKKDQKSKAEEPVEEIPDEPEDTEKE